MVETHKLTIFSSIYIHSHLICWFVLVIPLCNVALLPLIHFDMVFYILILFNPFYGHLLSQKKLDQYQQQTEYPIHDHPCHIAKGYTYSIPPLMVKETSHLIIHYERELSDTSYSIMCIH